MSVFANVPSPGHPCGIFVHNDQVTVSTSAGHPAHFNSLGEAVFTFSSEGRLLKTTRVDTGPNSNMGLCGIAADADDRFYVADMNGLVYRFGPKGGQEVWQAAPWPYSAGGWRTSMWNDIKFDPKGNAYITDADFGWDVRGDQRREGRIWRKTPSGELTLWFSDPRLSFAGPFQAQVDSKAKYLYFSTVLSSAPDRYGAGVLYRLPLKDKPSPADLEEIHRFPPEVWDALRWVHPVRGPYGFSQTNGVALGKSGRIYRSLGGRDELAVLDPNGKLIKMISSPLFRYPVYLAFLGDRLLVSNESVQTWDSVADDPSTWTILSVDVGDTGIEPFIPDNVR